LSRPIIFRSRRESLQENRIILAGSLQQTFATKSARTGHAKLPVPGTGATECFEVLAGSHNSDWCRSRLQLGNTLPECFDFIRGRCHEDSSVVPARILQVGCRLAQLR
jgi:hypothetical protein